MHGQITFPNKDIDDFVVLRSDGTPVYNMAVVSDDIAMRVTLVMRGDDHISNTPKQILLYHALGASLPAFAHLPMIHGTDGKKLSKRHGATAVADYQNQGILPTAMLNFLALLGWSPGGDREIMTVPEMVTLFSTDGLLRKAAIFDLQKLEWMNGQHLSLIPLEDLLPRVVPALVAAGLATAESLGERPEWFRSLIDLLRVRARTVLDIVRQAEPYLCDTISYDPEAVAKQWKDRAGVGQSPRTRGRAPVHRHGVDGSGAGARAARARGVAGARRRQDLPAAPCRPHRAHGEPRDFRCPGDARPRPVAGSHRGGGRLSAVIHSY